MTKNPFSFEDLTKSWSEWKNFDWESWFSACRSNGEAFNEVNQAAAENFQAILRRQAELAQKNAEESLALLKDLFTSSSNPENALSAQAEYVRSSIESSLNNARELAEMASKSNIEVFDLANKRVSKMLAELNKCCAQQGQGAYSQNKKKKEAA